MHKGKLILFFLLIILGSCQKELDETYEPTATVKVFGKEILALLKPKGVILDATNPEFSSYFWKSYYTGYIISDPTSSKIMVYDTGWYTVIYDNGKDSTRVVVLPAPIIFYPNTLHCGSSVNGIWKIVVSGIKDFHLKIFSQDNILVYESNDFYTHGWDGTYKGKDCSWGYYYFILKYTTLNGNELTKTGVIELIRY